jgi:leucyl/phenylalanyl-tRNA--protein transferase
MTRRDDPLPPQDGDLQRPSPELLLWAYRHGVFPMADPRSGVIDWYRPDPRGILPLDAFHVPGTLARAVRQRKFEIRSDTAFERVMRACAVDRSPWNRSWISDDLVRCYVELHHLGHAHSIEAWLGEQLVGGLYGVRIGAAFMGESMFSRPDLGGSNSSKICLVHLVRWLRSRGFILLDTQFWNPHLDQFGCIEVTADEYLARLQRAIGREVAWGAFQPLCE